MKRLLLLLVLAVPALAQEPAETAPVGAGTAAVTSDWPARTAQALAQPGALEALVGVRFLRDPDGGLVVLQGELDDPAQPRTLRCSVRFLVVGGMREEWTRLDCALDLASGRVTAVGSAVVRGRQQVFATGRVVGGTLTVELELREGDESTRHQTTAAWEPERIPWSWAVFFLPALREHLPAELRLRIYHEAVQQADPGLVTWRRDEGGGRWDGVFPGQPPIVVAVDAAGWRVDLGAAGILEPQSDEEGRRLQRAAGGAAGE